MPVLGPPGAKHGGTGFGTSFYVPSSEDSGQNQIKLSRTWFCRFIRTGPVQVLGT